LRKHMEFVAPSAGRQGRQCVCLKVLNNFRLSLSMWMYLKPFSMEFHTNMNVFYWEYGFMLGGA